MIRFLYFPLSFLCPDRSLPAHVIDTRMVTCALDCAFECLSNQRCLSYNYEEVEKVHHVCELNNASAGEAADLVDRAGFSYYDAGENVS